MDYRNFSALYTALCVSENEVFSKEAKEAITLAKKRIRIMFDKLFPNSVSDILKRPTFDSKVFFGIIAKYPEVLEGNEEKFLHFLASLAKSQQREPKDDYEITFDVIAILNSKQIENYVWEASNGRKEMVLAEGIEAVMPLIRVHAENTEVKKLEDKIASWLTCYPHITEYMTQANYAGGENWL